MTRLSTARSVQLSQRNLRRSATISYLGVMSLAHCK